MAELNEYEVWVLKKIGYSEFKRWKLVCQGSEKKCLDFLKGITNREKQYQVSPGVFSGYLYDPNTGLCFVPKYAWIKESLTPAVVGVWARATVYQLTPNAPKWDRLFIRRNGSYTWGVETRKFTYAYTAILQIDSFSKFPL